jgi:hypothetical protein
MGILVLEKVFLEPIILFVILKIDLSEQIFVIHEDLHLSSITQEEKSVIIFGSNCKFLFFTIVYDYKIQFRRSVKYLFHL